MKFNPVFIEGKTLDDTWFQLLHTLNEKGRRYLITEGSYKGAYRLAFDDVSGFIHYPHQRPLSPILPEGIPAPTNDEDIEKYFVEYLMNGKTELNEDYKYGTFIVGGDYHIPRIDYWYLGNKDYRKNYPIIIPNQLDWIIKHFKEKGFGNAHCFITIGYPESNFAYDIKYANEQERKTSPCLRGLDFRIIITKEYQCKKCGNVYDKDKKARFSKSDCECFEWDMFDTLNIPHLLTKVIYRSWDLWGGFPVNMGGFALLNEYIAEELKIEPGPLSFTCKDLHAYDFQLEVLKTRLGK